MGFALKLASRKNETDRAGLTDEAYLVTLLLIIIRTPCWDAAAGRRYQGNICVMSG